ncbi:MULTISPECIES: C15 family peptidase [Nocardiopsis]|uniref:Pyroglutamyl peptidase n=1 Tax=Nocardiopsis sinuspersici TaxID=501010 RepID=A0A1V3C104_9ACTN|nr:MULTISPECIES: pyroglutamyl peptidase [Nocardiopsis]OOC54040.1 pyroglutamyl peptidase [Nocardiopsis sinuspersici]
MPHHTSPEEERADLPEARSILTRSGFGAADPLFSADLRASGDLSQARDVVIAHASRLWTEAARDGSDDRPLYWARLVLTARLRSWQPDFPLSDAERAELLHLLETGSRGITDLDFPPGDRWIRVIVTGFDPFGLDEDPECSNPSGAAALDLNGWTFPVGEHTAVVRTAVFPVRWADFDAGLVEEALADWYGRADAVVTLSRGRPGRFDLEVWNGAWRGGGEDNLDVSCTGRIPVPDAPEWTRSSLPHEQITAAADQRPHPVAVNTEVAEVPAGGDETVWCPDGPTEGSSARSGGGGDYLSNEIAYRNTLLRDRSGQQVPAGHVHLPLVGGPDEEPEESAAVLAQVRLIVAAVAADAARTREWGSARAKG